jgi:hypothetical protein
MGTDSFPEALCFVSHTRQWTPVKSRKGDGEFIPVNAMKALMGRRETAPFILNVSNSFTSQSPWP